MKHRLVKGSPQAKAYMAKLRKLAVAKRSKGVKYSKCDLCKSTYLGTPAMHKFECSAQGAKLYKRNPAARVRRNSTIPGYERSSWQSHPAGGVIVYQGEFAVYKGKTYGPFASHQEAYDALTQGRTSTKNPVDYQDVFTAAQKVGYSVRDAAGVATEFKKTGEIPTLVSAQIRNFKNPRLSYFGPRSGYHQVTTGRDGVGISHSRGTGRPVEVTLYAGHPSRRIQSDLANHVTVRDLTTNPRGARRNFPLPNPLTRAEYEEAIGDARRDDMASSIAKTKSAQAHMMGMARGRRVTAERYYPGSLTRHERVPTPNPTDNPNALEVADAFASGKQHAVASNFYVHGNRIYSYGPHFPIAEWRGGKVVMTTRKSPSVTTSKHMTYVRRALSSRGIEPVMMELTPDASGPSAYMNPRGARRNFPLPNGAACNPSCVNPRHPHGAVENPGYGQRKDFQAFLARKRQEYGPQFDPSKLAREFVPYYESGNRIEVKFSYGETGRGRVGVTTGWQPVFLLMKTTRSMGSSETLSDKDHVVRVVAHNNPSRARRNTGQAATYESGYKLGRVYGKGGKKISYQDARELSLEAANANEIWFGTEEQADEFGKGFASGYVDAGTTVVDRRRAKKNPLLQMVTLAGMNPPRRAVKNMRGVEWIVFDGLGGKAVSKPFRHLRQADALAKDLNRKHSSPGRFHASGAETFTAARTRGRAIRRRFSRNPVPMSNPVNPPFKNGQKIPVGKAWAWVQKTGNQELIKQFKQAWELQKKANKDPKHVIWRMIEIGSPNKIEMVTAMAHYGDSPDTYYTPPKGSKKGGRVLYRHKWGEDGGGKKSVPLLAAGSGKALIMPLDGKKVAGDWLRH